MRSLLRPLGVALAAATVVTALLSSAHQASAGTATSYDRDCGDFGSQAAAQRFYLAAGGPAADPHGLDAEGDGVACESLPCPCLYGTGSKPKPPPATPPKGTQRDGVRIVRVVDGDTVEVRFPTGRTSSVRLIGIDTPEVYGGVECGGPEASQSARQLLPAGTRVRLVSDPTQDEVDRYGRLLRYVMKGARDIGRVQVARGHATVYVYGGVPFQRTSGYQDAERTAQDLNRGLWGRC
ncbi:hypothetical protein GON03_09915 [Nocardioides sp. MAH-18]|uniref:TNase-like domain-containing protein n=1 Tax=Nocardioides agri TaxID=2682843 RepID=A0A6L6XQB1_9ACTN|nr:MULTISPECIES: thermonuclease family protein [unclassified Nocardioides]MBA2954638.1 thermonuclease family protein [Nocardioides sp. CGMCC 1.13656]MVQ49494.1 hypothetical protein [Nocardioides sp. MAH-18]